MPSFEFQNIRDEAAFGCSSLLSESGVVYYEKISSTKNLGRVADLISAQGQSLGLVDTGIRTGLCALVSSVIRLLPTPTPLCTVEFGVDDDKVVIGVSFEFPGGAMPDADNLKDACLPFLTFFESILVRQDKESGRTEWVGLVTKAFYQRDWAPSTLDPEGVKLLEVSFKESSQKKFPQSHTVELGDLNYGSLLREEKPGSNIGAPPSGEIISRTALEIEHEARVKGQKEGGDRITRIAIDSGNQDILNQAFQRVEGSSKVNTLASSDTYAVKNSDSSLSESDVLALQERIKSLEAELDKKSNQGVRVSGDGSREVESTRVSGGVGGLFRRLFGMRSQEEMPTIQLTPRDEVDSVSTDRNSSLEDEGVNAEDSVHPHVQDRTNASEDESESESELRVQQLKKEVETLKSELKSKKSAAILDGMVGELVSAKAKVREVSKALDLSLKQKEHDFRVREQGLVEELRRSEDDVKKKEVQVNRLKEQLAQLSANLERIKEASSSSHEETGFKSKYQMAQKMLVAAKEESREFVKKIEDLRAQLSSQQASSKSKTSQSAELASVQNRYERTLRQMEEYKRVNATLSDKLNELKKGQVSGSTQEELRKRLEAATRIAAQSKKDSEVLQRKVEDTLKEEMRLKVELAKTQSDLKVMKATLARVTAKKAAA